MSDLSSTAGTVALIAGVIAVVALALVAAVAIRVRHVRRDQQAVIGDGAPRDVVGFVRDLERELESLSARVGELGEQGVAIDRRLDGAIAHSAVVRYDAHGEMSGRQSSSIALLDGRRNGVVLSSILHREQARLYAKQISAGQSELGLSPEEQEALDTALGDG